MRDLEHQEQAALFSWAATQNKYPYLDLMFAVPNGANKSFTARGKFKAEGLKPGVPDIFLPVARGVYHGLFIEMKPKPNKILKIAKRAPQEAQKRYIEALNQQGYLAVLCYGWEVAVEEIERYMSL